MIRIDNCIDTCIKICVRHIVALLGPSICTITFKWRFSFNLSLKKNKNNNFPAAPSLSLQPLVVATPSVNIRRPIRQLPAHRS